MNKGFFLLGLSLSILSSPVSFAQPPKDEISEITLRRGIMGRVMAPVYEVTFKSDGTAIYTGEEFVERKGKYRGVVSKDDFSYLASLLESKGFFALKDEYSRNITDRPETITSAVRGSDRKAVWNYAAAGPKELIEIEEAIDAVAHRIDWKIDT